ncbi:MAG: glycosyltransferase [Prevotellaceae bacterium]|jgi:hypothetical protein|nr:glycosyltransferase [Prevotellaceae bacterium]
MIREKMIIFGASKHGQRAFDELSANYDVVAYSDNNSNLWGRELNGVPVISPDRICDYGVTVCVCVCVGRYMGEVAKQLQKLGIEGLLLRPYGMEYDCNYGNSIPVIRDNQSYITKRNKDSLAVLFVQDYPCARTRKIATALKNRGVETYAISPLSANDSNAFINEYTFSSFSQLIDFVNNSDIDIVHSSNEPDEFSAVLTNANKVLVHDVHDLVSMVFEPNVAELSLEFLANTYADGVICTTCAMADMMRKKYNIGSDIHVLENYPYESFSYNRLPKLSDKDSVLHLVYSGAILQGPHYMYDKLWLKIVSQNVQIHFYSAYAASTCGYLESISPYIHYEGNYRDAELVEQLSQYDCGLLYFNLEHPKYFNYINNASPNKLYEYLDAGLPLAIGDVPAHLDFAQKHDCGGYLDLTGNIYTQLKKIADMKIPRDFLQKNSMTMDSQAERIIEFYKSLLK